MISGRIVSKIRYEKEYRNKRSEKLDREKATFIIKVPTRNDGDIFLIRGYDKWAKFLKKHGQMGSRVSLICRIESRKRRSKDVKKLAIELYTIDIVIERISELFDAKYESKLREELIMEQKTIEKAVILGMYPQEFEFDSDY